MEINRDVYLDRLIVRKHNGFIKVITGIRRSGKSYLLNTLFYNHLAAENIAPDHVIKFAFDSAEDLLKIGENPIILDNEKECIICCLMRFRNQVRKSTNRKPGLLSIQWIPSKR